MIKNVPEFKNENRLIYENGLTNNIIDGLNKSFSKAKKDVCKFAENFRGENTLESGYNIWNYIKENVVYKRDPDGVQIIKMPGALIKNGNTLGGDCKSMSLTIASVLSCLGAKNVRLRYVSFLNDKIPTHVYTVFDYEGQTIPVDSVIEKFNYEKPYTYKIDYSMNLYQLSGLYDYDRNTLIKSLRLQKPNSFCDFLIRKRIQSLDANNAPTIRISEDQFNKYQKFLLTHLSWHKKNNKFGLCYQLKVDELNDLQNQQLKFAIYNSPFLSGQSEIGRGQFFKKITDAGKKIVRATKKVSLAAPRNSFLLMVKLNIENIARRLKALPEEKVKKIWESLGGKYDNLKKEIERGSQKKKIGDIDDYPTLGNVNEIGTDPATATIVASAAAVLCAFIPLLAKSTKSKKPKLNPDGSPVLDDKGQPVFEDEPANNQTFWDKIKDKVPSVIEKFKDVKEILDFNDDGTTTTKKDVEIVDKATGFSINPKILLLGGAGIIALVLLTKK